MVILNLDLETTSLMGKSQKCIKETFVLMRLKIEVVSHYLLIKIEYPSFLKKAKTLKTLIPKRQKQEEDLAAIKNPMERMRSMKKLPSLSYSAL